MTYTHEHRCPDCGAEWPCANRRCGPTFDAPALDELSCGHCCVDDPGPDQDLRSPVREALLPGGWRVRPAEGA